MAGNNPIKPPRLVFWLVRMFCRQDYVDEVWGDLEEVFLWRVENKGLFKARLRLYLDAFSAIRFFRVQNKTTNKVNFLVMISLKVAIRTFKKRKLQSVLNLAGLATGFAVFMLIFQYVQFEKSYEAFNPHAANLYRVDNTMLRNGEQVSRRAESVAALGPYATDNYSEVEGYTKIYNVGAKNNNVITLIDGDKRSFREHKIFFVTKDFPELFALNMLDGTLQGLTDPNTVIISESTAIKYFGSVSEAKGRQVRFNDDDFRDALLTVQGIFKDYPGNSHMEFDILVSFKTLITGERTLERFEQRWRRNDFLTYLKLNPQAKPELVSGKLADQANEAGQFTQGYAFTFYLNRLSDIHFSPSINNQVKPTISQSKLDTLLIIGISILLLAWVNFINLTTAGAMERAKETGVRKVLGGTRKQLMLQYVYETILNCIVAFILALVLFYVLYPEINKFLPVADRWFLFRHIPSIALLLLILFTGSLLSAIYPAFVLSGYKSIAVMKGDFRTSGAGRRVRKGLVIFQSSISIFLITAVLGILTQIRYMEQQDLGMNTEQVLVVPRPGNLTATSSNESSRDIGDVFRDRLLAISGVEHFSSSTIVPGREVRWETRLRWPEEESNDDVIKYAFVKNDYLETLDVELLAGRDFINSTQDSSSIIINESALEHLGVSDPQEILGQTVIMGSSSRNRVVGVISDYHHEDLRSEVKPLVLRIRPSRFEFYMIKATATQLSSLLPQMERAFHDIFVNNPFDYFFLDEHFAENYQSESNFGYSFGFFATIAVVIAAIGLFGLSYFVTVQRRKEIGVRKVVGARVATIVKILNREFVILTLIASLISVPVAIYWINQWMSTFPYRASISIFLIVLPSVLMLLIALVSISYKTISAARVNPVNLLRDE